jgi:hypothetical protein
MKSTSPADIRFGEKQDEQNKRHKTSKQTFFNKGTIKIKTWELKSEF